MKLPVLSTIAGWISDVFSQFFGGTSEDAEKLKHEREMAELDALAHGRITPSYALRYAGTAVFTLLCVLIIIDAAFPGLIPGTPSEAVESVVKLAASVMTGVFGL